jgi:AraC family cel operon transcriptional repressor
MSASATILPQSPEVAWLAAITAYLFMIMAEETISRPITRKLAWHYPDGVLAHAERAFYPPGFRFPLHRHEFAELFLVERGRGVHRVGAQGSPLLEGDLVFVVPELEHAVEALPDQPVTFLNLEIDPGLYRELGRRFGASGWPWGGDYAPTRLDGEAIAALGPRLGEMEIAGTCRDRLLVESVLLDALWSAATRRRQRGALPEPLARVLRELDDPANLRGGVAGMAVRAGWSREHLNRQVRRHLGMTSVALLARHRLDHAARLLRHADLDVLAVCQRCGLDNLSHFYRLFRARFGCTPAKWRAKGTAGAV